jgi:8-oxo-dGTP pyrophosphatase MutT (NUDIX family)
MNERAAAIIINHGLLLLMHRRKPGKDYYVLPGGSVEYGETPEVACIREVREETGLAVALERKVLVTNNGGRLEHYFLVSTFEGTLCIGMPESERQSLDNQYTLEWVSLQHLDNINLQPASIRQICSKIP